MKSRIYTAVKIWIVIYPSITFFLALFGPKLAEIPLYQRTLILSLSLVPWILFVGLPLLEFVLKHLSKKAESK